MQNHHFLILFSYVNFTFVYNIFRAYKLYVNQRFMKFT